MKLIYNPDAPTRRVIELSPVYLDDNSILMKDVFDTAAKISTVNNQLAPLEHDGQVSPIIEAMYVICGSISFIRATLKGVNDGIKITDDNELDLDIPQQYLIPSTDTYNLLTTIIITSNTRYSDQNAHRLCKSNLLSRGEICHILKQ